jgi:hypothetical protein
MADQKVTSLAALMKSNAALRAAATTAKKVVTQRDFTGPVGDYICIFKGTNIILKDGKTLFIIKMAVDGSVEGQGEFNGAAMDIVHGLYDDDRQSAGEKLARLFQDIQRLGIDTADATLEQIDSSLQAIVNKHVTMRVVLSAKGDRQYFNIRGLAQAGREEQDYSTLPEEAPAAAAKKGGRKPKAESAPAPVQADEDDWNDAEPEVQTSDDDDWGDELAQDAAGDPQETEQTYRPSDWIGYNLFYKPKNAPKRLEFKVIDADDESGMVVLERDGRKIKAKYDDCSDSWENE